MKYITLIIGLLVVGCGTTPTMKSVVGEYERKEDDLPVEDLDVIFLEINGDAEWRRNGQKLEEWGAMGLHPLPTAPRLLHYVMAGLKHVGQWGMGKDRKIHIEIDCESGFLGSRRVYMLVFRINSDGSITWITLMEDGDRIDIPKEQQVTYQKIK